MPGGRRDHLIESGEVEVTRDVVLALNGVLQRGSQLRFCNPGLPDDSLTRFKVAATDYAIKVWIVRVVRHIEDVATILPYEGENLQALFHAAQHAIVIREMRFLVS